MRTLVPLLLLAIAFFGCSSSQPPPQKMTWSEVQSTPAPTARPAFDAAAFAAEKLRPAPCEQTARGMLAESPNDAWAALKVCAQNPDFTLLRELLAPAWAEQLKKRPDAMRMLGRVIANRGGSIGRDVAVLNESRFPLFSFAAAMAQPDTYKGKHVLLRGVVTDLKTKSGANTVMLAEYSLAGSETDMEVGPRSYTKSNREGSVTSSRSGSGNASYNTTKYGSGSAKGSFRSDQTVSGRSSSSTVSGKTVKKFDNTSTETGRQALGKLAKADPFLVPDKEFVILARFDGTRMSDNSAAEDEEGAEPTAIGVLTILDYVEPNALVVY